MQKYYRKTHVEQILEQHVGLVLGHALDAACEASVDENALPSGYSWFRSVFAQSSKVHGRRTVRSDHWVDCFQGRAVVQWGSSRNCPQWVAQSLGLFVEELCIVYGGESLQVGGH